MSSELRLSIECKYKNIILQSKKSSLDQNSQISMIKTYSLLSAGPLKPDIALRHDFTPNMVTIDHKSHL